MYVVVWKRKNSRQRHLRREAAVFSVLMTVYGQTMLGTHTQTYTQRNREGEGGGEKEKEREDRKSVV